MSKRDIFAMSGSQELAGRQMWHRTGQQGRFATSSFDAEAMAPKTWLFYVNSKNELISKPIECELYVVGRLSNAGEAVVMLHGMCPKCGETFIAREDNKTMTVDKVTYARASTRLREQWKLHCGKVMGRPPRDADEISVVSSPERWACDYCKGWCVKVYGGVAVDDHKGVTQAIVHARPEMIINAPAGGGSLEF